MASPSTVAQCLAGTLSSESNIRMSAELQLSELLTSPGVGLTLSQLVLSQDLDPSLWCLVDHSAIISLRKYVTQVGWTPGSDIAPEIKAQIRQAVFQGLSDPNRKIRSLCAHLLSTIAEYDWPEDAPELLTSLIHLLSSNSPDPVHGAMQVFTEFIRSDLTENQLLPVLRQLLPVLLTILGSAEHTPLTRARTISVFRQCITALFMVKDHHPEAVNEATASVLPVWLDAFKVLLNIDPQEDVSSRDKWDGLAIRLEIFKTLETIFTSFPRATISYLPDFLSASLNHLRALFPAFSHYYLTPDQTAPHTSEDEPLELPQLVCPLIDFVSNVTRSGKAKTWYEQGNLVELVSTVCSWIQMTIEDEENWSSSANAFVSQEYDEMQVNSVRVAEFDLLQCLLDRMPVQTAAAFNMTMQRVVPDSRLVREAGNIQRWRPLEAALAAIGSQSSTLLDIIEDEQTSGRPKPIDIESLLTDVVPSFFGLSECPFLQGRGFVFAGKFAKLLPDQVAGHYLDAAVKVVEAQDIGIPVKLSAVIAIGSFCKDLSDSVVVTFAPRMAADLGPFLLLTTEDTLFLVLDTISAVVDVDEGKWLTPDLANYLTVAVLDAWAKSIKDPLFVSLLGEIFTSLASSKAPGMYEVVVRQALPPLCAAMGSAKPEEAWVSKSAIDLVTDIMQGAPESGLGDGFFATLAPSLFPCLRSAEDRDILQNGVSCLTLIIRKDVGQLLSWSDNEGRSGIDNVLSVVAKLLENLDESGGLVIGDLIIHLLRRAGDAILPVLPEMLRTMVGRMSNAKTATFLQSLIIPFCFLINNQRDTVLSLLESIQIQGHSGLDIFIQTWCENAETFQGLWPSRVSTLALCHLYVSERPSLQNLLVKGDIIMRPETRNVIMTRSRTKIINHEFTSIPFPAKAIKLLLRDLQLGEEANSLNAQGDSIDVESDDGDEDWDEEESIVKGEDVLDFESEMTAALGMGMAFDNQILDSNDDEDLENDPVSQMDMQAHLVSFFKECAARNTNNFSSIVEKLSAEEISLLRRVVSE